MLCLDGFGSVQASVGAAPDYEATAPGVITEWRTTGQANDVGDKVRLLVNQRDSPIDYTLRFASQTETLAAGDNSFPTHFAVKPGDVIGTELIDDGAGFNTCVVSNANAGDSVVSAVVPPVGVSQPYAGANMRRLQVAALIEPDSDGDGFGDETEDNCDVQPTAGACDLTVQIDSGPKKKTKRKKATFTFSSVAGGITAFECKFDKKPYKPCTSPRVIKKAKPRKHRFRVRGVDPDGTTLGSSVSKRWRVTG